MNALFVHELRKYIPRPEMIDIYKVTIFEAWYEQTNYSENNRKALLAQIKELEVRISYSRDLLSSKQIDPEDFRQMKVDYTTKLEKLEVK